MPVDFYKAKGWGYKKRRSLIQKRNKDDRAAKKADVAFDKARKKLWDDYIKAELKKAKPKKRTTRTKSTRTRRA